MSEQRILKLATPLLRTWSSDSHLMAMILVHDEAIAWVLNNYINIYGRYFISEHEYSMVFLPDPNPEERNSIVNAWVACPFLDVTYISHNFVRNNYKNMLEYVIHAIDSGYYLYFWIYQENLSVRMNLPFHKIFIYGYDRVNKKIYVADHYDNGKYIKAEIGFEEFLEAYEITYSQMSSTEEKTIQEEHPIIIAKPKFYKYNFNLDWLKIQLKDYLKSTYTLDCIAEIVSKDEENYFWGINCYDVMIEYLGKLRNNEESVRKDCRLFTIISDHKKLLKMRVEYFENRKICEFNKEEIKQYEVLCKCSESLLNNFIKYQMTNKESILIKMQKTLIEMRKIELELLYIFQEKISN